jgi:hypothetical protein
MLARHIEDETVVERQWKGRSGGKQYAHVRQEERSYCCCRMWDATCHSLKELWKSY